MIPGVNIISRNSSIANINRSEGSGSTLSPSVVVIGGRAPLEKVQHLISIQIGLKQILMQPKQLLFKAINAQKLNVNQSAYKSSRKQMSQTYENTKRSKPKENQLKIYPFCWKIHQRASGPGQSAAGVMQLSMRIHTKICCMFPLKVAKTLLSGSMKGTVGAQQSHNIVQTTTPYKGGLALFVFNFFKVYDFYIQKLPSSLQNCVMHLKKIYIFFCHHEGHSKLPKNQSEYIP